MGQRRDLVATGGRQANNNKHGFLVCNRDPRFGGGIVFESTPVEEVELSPLPEMIAMLNDVRAMFNAHCADGSTAHTVADATNPVSTSTYPDATDEGTAYTLANALKAAYTAHIALTTGSVHDVADSTNTIGEADATTFASLCTLVEALEDEYTDHRVNVSSCHDGADITNVITAPAYGSKTCTTAKFPANSINLGVCTYVTEGAATAVNFDVGVTGTATLFATNELDTLDKADQNLSLDENASEVAIILTPDARPTTIAGKVLVQGHYIRLLPLVSGKV